MLLQHFWEAPYWPERLYGTMPLKTLMTGGIKGNFIKIKLSRLIFQDLLDQCYSLLIPMLINPDKYRIGLQ